MDRASPSRSLRFASGLLVCALLCGCGEEGPDPAAPPTEPPPIEVDAPPTPPPATTEGAPDPDPLPPDPDAITLTQFFEAMSGSDADARAHALYRLDLDFTAEDLATHRSRFLPALVKLLDDPEGEARRAALIALTRLAPLEADAQAAAAKRLGDPEIGVRAQAADLLGRAKPGDADAAAALLAGLDDPAPAVRQNVLASLIRLGKAPKGAEAQIVQVLGADPDDEARAEAALALGELGLRGPAATKALLKAATEPHSEVRAAAAWALGHLRLAPAQSKPILEALLADENPEVRGAAEAALKALGADK